MSVPATTVRLLSEIKEDLLRLQELLTPEEEAEIESCYYELRRKSLLNDNSFIEPEFPERLRLAQERHYDDHRGQSAHQAP